MPERALLVNKDMRRLKQVYTKGGEYDFMTFLSDGVVSFKDDFLGKAIDTTNLYTTGGAGTAAALVTNEHAIQLACNANASSIYIPGTRFTPNQDLVMRARVKLSTLTAAKVEIGFADNNLTGTIGATAAGSFQAPLVATPVVTAPTTDNTVAILDASSALTGPSNWRLAASKAGVGQLATPTTTAADKVAPTANVYQTIVLAIRRIELGATDDTMAQLFVNGAEVCRINSAATTAAVQQTPYILVRATAASAVILTVDFWEIYSYRDYTQG